ncbi:hypothetical protein Lal_00039113 [Lupinus albus]|nr:hypothetical protein Lal_00039113 [Lupinus albus]
MAQKQKRPSPHDVPPSVSSDDEPIPSSQPDSDKEEEKVESSSEEDEKKTQSQSKNPKSPSSPESVTDSDSSSDSESESESHGVSNYQIQPKPLASKPLDETPIKSNSKSLKRPVEESNGSGDVNRAKKKKVTDASSDSSDDDDDDDDDGKVEAAEVKKSSGVASDSKSLPFQRLFSEEDEIAILDGMIDFKKKTGNDPLRFVNFFHRFVSKSLHIDASSNQLKDKIQRLRRKFMANVKGKSFSKRHDEIAFELSKKIWGNAGGANEVVEKAKSNGKASEIAKKEGSRGNEVLLKSKPEPKQEVKLLMYSKDSKEEALNKETGEKTDFPLSIAQGFGLYGLNENMMKKGLDLMGSSDRAKLEKQWKELEAAEFEANVKRIELVAKQSRLILEAYAASNH